MFSLNRTFISLVIIDVFVINFTYGAVVAWGEKCQFTAECMDHRLVCEETTVQNIEEENVTNSTETICVCDRFHEWKGELVGCVLKYKTEEILDQLEEKYDIAAKIEYEANLVFFAQMAAGLLVVGVGMVCSLIVVAYCIRMWKMDNDLDDLVKNLESQKEAKKPSTSRRPR